MGRKIVKKMIFPKCSPLVGKSLPHLVGVFCTPPELPSCHIMQKINFCVFFCIFGFSYIFLLFAPLKGLPIRTKFSIQNWYQVPESWYLVIT